MTVLVAAGLPVLVSSALTGKTVVLPAPRTIQVASAPQASRNRRPLRGPSPPRRSLRPLRRWLPLAPAALTLSLAVKGLHPSLPGWPCPLRALTGIPCPTCFLTRATAAALTGQFDASVRLHAFGPLAALALLWWSAAAIRQRRLLPRPPPAWPFASAGIGLLAYWFLRLTLHFGWGIAAFPAQP